MAVLSFRVMSHAMLERLEGQQLIVVTGKGGVGKTTLAAVLGRWLASTGRRTLLLEIDPRESLHQLLGTEPSGGDIVTAGEGLSSQNVQARSVIYDLVREKVPIRALARRIVESPVFQHFADGAPGLKEMAVLGYALRMVEGFYRRRVDVVVLDAPATGHGASMLAAPMLLAQSSPGGQLGEMADTLAKFIADPSRCGVVLVTMGEEMPVQEAIELTAKVRVEEFIPGRRFRNVHVACLLEGQRTDRVALPAWVLAYRYRDTPYRAIVHGHRGEVVFGSSPKDWVKITILVLAIAAVVAIVAAVIAYLQ